MSEAANEAPKKKKSPLPIVLALVLVLGGGGFFMTKGKGEKKEDKTLVKLAKEEIELEEFLVNMSDRTTYLRTKIAVKLKDGYERKGFDENISAVQDAVVRTLRSTAPEEIRTDQAMVNLKRRLAKAMNNVLPSPDKEETHHEGKTTQIRIKTEATELPPDWDSATGPVLQVFFKSFATQ